MIAVAGPNLPLEVLLAADRYAGALNFDPDRPVRRAREWLESKFAPWAPVVLDMWAEGAYDRLDAVLFSRADDTSQRLYYYVDELQRRSIIGGPKPMIFDIALIPREASKVHTARQVKDLMDQLEVSPAALEHAIGKTNALRREKPLAGTRPSCILTGSPPPDRRLHEAIVRAGFSPIGETLMKQWTKLGGLIAENTGDPAAALADKLQAQRGSARNFADRSAELADSIKLSGCAAVIVWEMEEDEARTWHLPAERRVLAESGVPHIVMTRRDWLCRDGAAGEIEEFLGGISS